MARMKPTERREGGSLHPPDLWLAVYQIGTKNGAGDRDRTGDIQLGKLAFYR